VKSDESDKHGVEEEAEDADIGECVEDDAPMIRL